MNIKRIVFQSLSLVGLLMTVIPSALVLTGVMEWQMHALLMLIGAALWFLTAPAWMRNESPDST